MSAGTRGPTVYDYPHVFEAQGMRLGHFGCIMLDVEPVPVTELLGNIDVDAWYYVSPSDLLRYVKGPVAETSAHATLLYGLTPDDDAGIRARPLVDRLLEGLDLGRVTVKSVGSFPGQNGEPYACVVAHLSTEVGDLAEANRRLRFLPHIDTFLEYRAHVTLAYVRTERRDETVHILNEALAGMTLRATGINYGGEIK